MPMTQSASDHPLINTNKLKLQTRQIELLQETLHQWGWNGATGGLVYGDARIGKTQALLQIKDALRLRDGTKIPGVYFSVATRDVNTIAGIYRIICESLKIAHTNRTQADYLADSVTYYLMDLAHTNQTHFVALFVDEMQRLHVKQLNIFAELYDRLRLLDITLMTVFVGNDPECMDLVELVKEKQYAHLRGRFFSYFYQFGGVSSAADVKRCLRQYDKKRYPADGPTYTQFFLPEAFQQGFRLHHLSSDIWRYYCEYAKPFGIKSWAMQYFVAAINCLLLDFLPQHGVDEFCQDMLNAALDVSGLLPSTV